MKRFVDWLQQYSKRKEITTMLATLEECEMNSDQMDEFIQIFDLCKQQLTGCRFQILLFSSSHGMTQECEEHLLLILATLLLPQTMRRWNSAWERQFRKTRS